MYCHYLKHYLSIVSSDWCTGDFNGKPVTNILFVSDDIPFESKISLRDIYQISITALKGSESVKTTN